MLCRVRQLGFCTHCNQTNEQTRLNIQEFWKCVKCGRELRPPKGPGPDKDVRHELR